MFGLEQPREHTTGYHFGTQIRCKLEDQRYDIFAIWWISTPIPMSISILVCVCVCVDVCVRTCNRDTCS